MVYEGYVIIDILMMYMLSSTNILRLSFSM